MSYAPEDVGRYVIGVKYGGKTVPKAPFYVNTKPTGDASKVKIAGKCRRTLCLIFTTDHYDSELKPH